MRPSRKEYIIWLDEVGRWPLAGPVVVGGVFCLPSFRQSQLPSWCSQVTDSKKLSSWQREYLSTLLVSCTDIVFATSFVSAKYIDRYGIVVAIRRASLDVIQQIIIKITPLLWENWKQKIKILLDGKTDYGIRQKINTPLTTIVKWDSSIWEIGAASIIAKVRRDQYMIILSNKKRYQHYEFNRHKGYGTLLHRTAIAQYGLSDVHRVSFCKNIIPLVF